MEKSPEQNKLKQLAGYVKKNPGDSFSKFALALEFLKVEQYNKARILFEDIRQNDPDYSGVYYHLGRLYEMMDRLQDARQVYEEGIGIARKQQQERTVTELKEVLAEVEIELDNRNQE